MEFIEIAKNARRIDGLRVGRLVALGPVRRAPLGVIIWLCQCDCGNQTEVHGHDLRSGKTKSCGCLNKEMQATRFRTHDKCYTSEYRIWSGIKTRCYNAKNHGFYNYGGRGITMCDRWLNGNGNKSGFECFLDDVGERKTSNLSIERRNNDGNYCKENCMWATPLEQGRNKRNNVLYTINGETKTAPEWERAYGLSKDLIRARMKKGWSVEKAIMTPLDLVRSGRQRAGFLRKKEGEKGQRSVA
jgi:hypothetical protein